MQQEQDQGQITNFFLAAWVGGGSKEFSLSTIGSDGIAEVKLNMSPDDVNTVKLAVTFNVESQSHTERNCHLASNFITTAKLSEMLAEKQAPMGAPFLKASPKSSISLSFSADQQCLSVCDNFTSNSAVLRFADKASDLREIAKLQLRPSSLLSLDRVNNAIGRLGVGLQNRICNFAVSPLNAGPQYMEAFSFGQMQNHMTHYAILGHVFSSMSSPVDLPWITYNICQAVQSTGLSVPALLSMSDVDFVQNFGVHVLSKQTACSLTSIYSSDLTVNAAGGVCKLRETEDIAKTFSCLSLRTQIPPGAKPYAPGIQARSRPTVQECLSAMERLQEEKASGMAGEYSPPPFVSDDCENLTEAAKLTSLGICAAFKKAEQAVLSKVGSSQMGKKAGGLALAPASPLSNADHLSMVAAEMSLQMCAACSATNPHVFTKMSKSSYTDCGLLATRMGHCLTTGQWGTEAAVVSAKGASYDSSDPRAAAEGLSGHGTLISRIRDLATGACYHSPVELTTYFAQDPKPPPCLAKVLTIRLSGQPAQGEPAGFSFKKFTLSDLATTYSQNVHREVGVSENCCTLAHICSDYSKNPLECPFYVSMFYSGLSEGPSGSIGCIPLDTNPPANFGAGCRPLFGAPVMGLSNKSTIALPVTSQMLSTPGADDGEEILGIMREQVSEAWSPEADPKTIAHMASFWHPCEPPDSLGVVFQSADEYASHIRSETTWAFKNPEHTAHAVHLYKHLADRFNAIQARDASSDGARAYAFGQYLSATLRFTMPIPRASMEDEPTVLSGMRNLRRAATELGFNKIAAFRPKMAAIHARAKIPSDHPFYMCDRGGGVVHSHRHVLA